MTDEEREAAQAAIARREADISAFKTRVFSGNDVLHILEGLGVGVGVMLRTIETIESQQHDGFDRDWTFTTDLLAEDVLMSLARMMGVEKRKRPLPEPGSFITAPLPRYGLVRAS